MLPVVTSTSNHLEANVLQTGGLGNLPVNTRPRVRGQGGQVDDEVTNLPEEIVLIGVPILSPLVIWIRIDDRNPHKGRSGLERGKGLGITHKLGKVELNDGSTDQIRAGWEIDQSGGYGGRVTTSAASWTLGDGPINGIGVIINTVS